VLSQNLAAVEAEFSSLTNAPTFHLGDKYLSDHASPPRVVWVPKDEPTAPGQLNSESLSQQYKAILTRKSTVEAHVWGASFSQTEAIVHCLCTVWRDLFRGCGNVDSIRWPEKDEVGWMAKGHVAIVQAHVDIPVMDQLVDIPDAADAAENAEAYTTVTVVEGTPSANEINLSRGNVEIDQDPTD